MEKLVLIWLIVVAMPRDGLDVADPESVRRVVAAIAPRVIVNCAAFNDVDGAERRPRDAFAVNAHRFRQHDEVGAVQLLGALDLEAGGVFLAEHAQLHVADRTVAVVVPDHPHRGNFVFDGFTDHDTRTGWLLRFTLAQAGNVRWQINELTAGYKDKTQYFIDKLAEGIDGFSKALVQLETDRKSVG